MPITSWVHHGDIFREVFDDGEDVFEEVSNDSEDIFKEVFDDCEDIFVVQVI